MSSTGAAVRATIAHAATAPADAVMQRGQALARGLPHARADAPPVLVQLGLGGEPERADLLRAVLSSLGHRVFVPLQPEQGWASVSRDADVLQGVLDAVADPRVSIVPFSKGGHVTQDVLARPNVLERVDQVVSVGVPYGGFTPLGTVSARVGASLSQPSNVVTRSLAKSGIARGIDTAVAGLVRASARDGEHALVARVVDELLANSSVVRATQGHLATLDARAALTNPGFRLMAISGRRTGTASDGVVTTRSALVPERPPVSRNVEVVAPDLTHGAMLDRADVIGHIARALSDGR